jgi:3-deoxy-D-manno-octulosonic-acid transferase
VRLLYHLFILVYVFVIRLAAFFGNQKAKQWISGRKNQEEKIRKSLHGITRKKIWIHCASLGEFEQGRPLIEKIKSSDPSFFIVLSFFSPSGYELQKNYPVADMVCYLPIDSRTNAKKFIGYVNPSYVLFIKYEYWLFYFEELKRKNIPLFIASGIFRENQIFFKWYGKFYKNILKNVTQFFVQDLSSKKLLNKAGFQNVIVSGDTRFDRVAIIVKEEKKYGRLENFVKENRIIIAGSTWPEDDSIILHVFAALKHLKIKLIIAPHEISESRVEDIIRKAKNMNVTSTIEKWSSKVDTNNASILILDTIGMLSSVYRYGTIAWIGGGFGKGIHNTLEAATFGLPVIFGPNFEKFREAKLLIECGGAFSIKTKEEALQIISKLLTDYNVYQKSSKEASTYVKSNTGATEKIYSELPDLKK